MSQIRADNITNRQGTGAPIFVNGIRVTGLTSISSMVANTGTFSGAVSIGGTLTYEDVTNVDSVGIITARNGIKVTTGGVEVAAGGIDITTGNVNLADNGRLRLGASQDLQIYHNGTDTLYENTTGNVYFRNDGNNTYFQMGTGNEASLTLSKDGPVIASYNGVTKFQTQSYGVKVLGGYSETITAVSGTAVDCATGSYFTKTITGATTFTFTNVPAGVAYAFTFEVTLNGSNAITWPASVKWPADTAPTITDGKTQVFVFLTDDGGTRWRGSSLVDYTN